MQLCIVFWMKSHRLWDHRRETSWSTTYEFLASHWFTPNRTAPRMSEPDMGAGTAWPDPIILRRDQGEGSWDENSDLFPIGVFFLYQHKTHSLDPEIRG